jgi:hypothetical protein
MLSDLVMVLALYPRSALMYSYLLLKKLMAPEFNPNFAITATRRSDNLLEITVSHARRWLLNTDILSASVRGKMEGRYRNLDEAAGGTGGMEMLKLPCGR